MKGKENLLKDDFIGLSGPLWESWTIDDYSSGYHTTSTEQTEGPIEFGVLNACYQGDQDRDTFLEYFGHLSGKPSPERHNIRVNRSNIC